MNMILKMTLGLLLVLMAIASNAQVNLGKPSFERPLSSQIDSTFKDRPNFGIDGFLYLDMVIIGATPTLGDYKGVKTKIIGLPKDHIRYIDSIDYYLSPDGALDIQIYSQNYAYRSSNRYRLVKEKGSLNGLLALHKVFDIDTKMKTEIESIERYRVDHFDIEVVESDVKGNQGKRRFIVNKTYR